MANIEPGYMLKITTWENDADNYNTKTLTGLTIDQTRFYIEVAKLFYTCHGSKGTFFGNSERRFLDTNLPIETEWEEAKERYHRDNDDLLPLRVKQIVDRYRENGWGIPKHWDYTVKDPNEWMTINEGGTRSDFYDYYGDLINDLIDCWNDGDYWRVFEGFEVFYVPDEIENVTAKFY